MPTKIPQTITIADISRLKEIVAAGGASQAYTWLADKGYPYPLLARGVVNSDTLSGATALTFMDSQAIKQTGHELSRAQEQNIKQDMANAYLDQLARLADPAGNVSRDVTYKEAWNFHNKVFEKNDLSPATWTLDTPLQIALWVDMTLQDVPATIDGARLVSGRVLVPHAIPIGFGHGRMPLAMDSFAKREARFPHPFP